MIAKVTSEGRITIPLAIRERLGLKAGDQIDFDEESPLLVGRKVVNREQWGKTIAEWRKMAAESLKGDPWEHMSSDEIMADLRGDYWTTGKI